MDALPDALLELLRAPSPCFIATVQPDGSPHLTQTWVTTDGEHVVINTVEGYRKTRNVEADPRVSVAVADPDDTSRYFSVVGRVVERTTDGAAAEIDELSQKYLGRPYPGFGGGRVRVTLRIAVDQVIHSPW